MRKKKSYEGKTWDDCVYVYAYATGYRVHLYAQEMGINREGQPFADGSTEIFELSTLPEFIMQRMAVLNMLAPLDEIEGVGYRIWPLISEEAAYRIYLTPDEKPVLLEAIARSREEKTHD